jgi:hypothetical protein
MRTELESHQDQFAQALIDIDLIGPALATFKGDAKLNRERFAYYRGNISAIWEQSCASAYPVLQQLTGADFFNDLARAYGRAHPSQSGDLTEFGASMPAFINTLGNCRDYPYLSDVAALEWLVHRAYYLKHESTVTLAELAAIPPSSLGDLRCRLQPCCALFESPWAVGKIWDAHRGDVPTLPDEVNNKSTSLIWRDAWQSGGKVQVNPLSSGAFAALRALAADESLGMALEKALSADPEFAVQTELADWFQKQLIVSIT